MGEHSKIETSAEVYAVMMAKHRADFKPFATYSAPEGDMFGDPSVGVMMTEWGFDGADFPSVGVETRWDIRPEKPYERHNERHEYWLCVGVECEG